MTKIKGENMFSEVHKRVRKAGSPPGTAIYTGDSVNEPTVISVITISSDGYKEVNGKDFSECFPINREADTIWVNVEGLNDVATIEKICTYFKLHPLTTEDILNTEQRPKVEEFDNYLYITLKVLALHPKRATFSIKQLSIVLGKNFVLTFQEVDRGLFSQIRYRLHNQASPHSRFQSCDYLTYRFLDSVVDEYFLVLEGVGDQIETLEQSIVINPTIQKSRMIYQMKRQALMLRKAIWPLREVINRLLHIEDHLISKFTNLYFRDVYDHIVQGMDTLETFRDILSSMLDMYLSSLTNRMNEIMKTLTIISTIFIPITAIASIYGMNFKYIPGLNNPHGFLIVGLVMSVIAVLMIIYFYRKKWL